MRIEDEKEESEEIKEKNDENTGIGNALMNTKSDIIVLDQTHNCINATLLR